MIQPVGIVGSPAVGSPAVDCEIVLASAAPHLGPPDLSGTVDRFSHPVEFGEFGEPVTVDANGYPVTQSGPGCFIALAHVFYASLQTVDRLPRGFELGATAEIHSSTLLKVADPATRRRGQRLIWDGRIFEVSAQGNRSSGPGGVFRWGVFFARMVAA